MFLQRFTLAALLALAPIGARAQASDQVQQWMNQGSAAMQHGDAAGAVDLFTKATVAAPRLASAFLGLGLAELRSGDTDKAEAALKQTLALDPSTAGAHMFLGIAEYQAGDAKEAAADLRKEIALQPDSVEALTWLGIVELDAGHAEAAATPLDHAAALAPKDPTVLYYRGRAHTLIAAATYRQLYNLDPDSPWVHRALAESLAAANQPAKAIDEYQAAISKQPGNADLYEALANEDQKVSRFDPAASAYEEELKLNPNSAVALYNLGKIDVEHGKASSGIERLQRAAELGADPGPTQFYLGYGLAQLNRDQPAATALEASLAAKPSAFIERSAWYQLGRVYTRLGRKADAQHAFAQVQKMSKQGTEAILGQSQP